MQGDCRLAHAWPAGEHDELARPHAERHPVELQRSAVEAANAKRCHNGFHNLDLNVVTQAGATNRLKFVNQ